MTRSTPRFRLLIVGYGTRARQLMPEVARTRELEPAGLVDPDPSARSAPPDLPAWTTLGEALSAGAFDAALIASPPGEHAAHALSCLRAGLGVLVEKPFALTASDAGEVAAAARQAGRPALVSQNFRFRPRERAIRMVLSEGTIGEPVESVVTSVRPAAAAPGHTHSMELGPLWDICSHHLDSFRIRYGGEPDSILAEAGSRAGDDAVEFVSAVLVWSAGPRVVYHHSETAPVYHYLEVLEGSRGTITAHDERVTLWLPGRRGRRIALPRAPREESETLGRFVRCLAGGDPGDLGADDNIRTVAMVEAAARSARSGRAVSPADLLAAADAGRGD